MQRAEHSIGWFPILFFTSVWVSEIYKHSVPQGPIDDTTFEADAVRSGNRALFIQALVNITCALGLPLIIGESGIQLNEAPPSYARVNGNGTLEDDGPEAYEMGENGISNGSTWKTAAKSSKVVARWTEDAKSLILSLRDPSQWTLPIKGWTLIRLWAFAQFLFAGAMILSW